MMRQFLFIIHIILFSQVWCKESTGTVIFLKGPCSVGKSSICRALAQSDKSWKAIDEDEYHIKYTVTLLKKKFPIQFIAIKDAIRKCNRYHALLRKDILFKSSISEEQKQSALESIKTITGLFFSDSKYIIHKEMVDIKTRKKVLQHISQYAGKVKNVIVDSWLLNEDDFLQIRQKFTVLKGIAYAPLQVLLNRINKRNRTANETGNLMSKRFIRQPLYSYRQLYNFSSEPTSGIILDTLDKDYFIRCIESVRSQLTLPREMTQEELDAYKKRMLEKFNDQELLITANSDYDFVINTKKNIPKFYAALIKKKIKSFNKS